MNGSLGPNRRNEVAFSNSPTWSNNFDSEDSVKLSAFRSFSSRFKQSQDNSKNVAKNPRRPKSSSDSNYPTNNQVLFFRHFTKQADSLTSSLDVIVLTWLWKRQTWLAFCTLLLLFYCERVFKFGRWNVNKNCKHSAVFVALNNSCDQSTSEKQTKKT